MCHNSLTRRDFLKQSVSGLTAAALPLTMSCSGTETPAKYPNVLFIVIDDLNDWISCLGGHPDVKTPNIDRLASRGVLFTNAHCASPACCPSRTAVMTGIRPSTSGVYSNSQFFRNSEVLRNAITLPQHFMAHGYRAMGSGKIYHGIYPDPESWDDYWPSKMKTRPPDPMPENRPVNGIPDTRHFDWGPVDVPNEAMGDRQVADWVSGQLEIKHKNPFFIACGFYRPHLPWYVPKKYFDMYPVNSITLPEVNLNDLDDVPAMGRKIARPQGDHTNVIKYGQWRKAVQGYLASITFADECVGRVIDALDRSKYRNNTVVVLWSDHGWHLGEKLHWRKFSLWEEATHNVLAVVAPGVTQQGGRCDSPVNLLYIYPTLIDVCGVSGRNELEGKSLIKLLHNPEAAWDRPALTTHGRGSHSVRSKDWRYIRYSDGTEELYDHTADKLEWDNLANDPRYDDVKKDLARWLPESDAPNSPVDDAETRKRIQNELEIQLP